MSAWEVILYYLYVLLLAIGMMVFWVVTIIMSIAISCLIMKVMIYIIEKIFVRDE